MKSKVLPMAMTVLFTFGIALHNWTLGICLGLCMGMAFGLFGSDGSDEKSDK